MLVSIVMAARNAGYLLGETIESAIQSVNPMTCEVIVVDDGSTDSSLTEIPQQVRILRNRSKRLGCSSARHLGVRYSRGDVVIVCDPHCAFPSNALFQLATLAKEYNGIVQPPVVIDGRGGPVTRGSSVSLTDKGIVLRRRRKRPNNPVLHGGIYAASRRTLDTLHNIPPMPGWYGEYEVYASLLCYRLGLCVGIANTPTCTHLNHKSLVSNRPFDLPDGHRAINKHWCYSICLPGAYEGWLRQHLDAHYKGVDYQFIFDDPIYQRAREYVASNSKVTEDWVLENVLRIPNRTVL